MIVNIPLFDLGMYFDWMTLGPRFSNFGLLTNAQRENDCLDKVNLRPGLLNSPLYIKITTMSSPIDLFAIISPKPGKVDRVRSEIRLPYPSSFTDPLQVVELLQEVSEYVKQNEPGTLKYEIHREVNKKSGAEQVIMIESCKLLPFGPSKVT